MYTYAYIAIYILVMNTLLTLYLYGLSSNIHTYIYTCATDFRLMEAVASGALIFVDHMYVPRPHPMIHDKHIVYYGTRVGAYIYHNYDFVVVCILYT